MVTLNIAHLHYQRARAVTAVSNTMAAETLELLSFARQTVNSRETLLDVEGMKGQIQLEQQFVN